MLILLYFKIKSIKQNEYKCIHYQNLLARQRLTFGAVKQFLEIKSTTDEIEGFIGSSLQRQNICNTSDNRVIHLTHNKTTHKD